MRLIDADALPMSWQPDCNGNDTFVTRRDLDAALPVCCAECVKYGTGMFPFACTDERLEQIDDGMPKDFEPPDGFGCSYFERRQG